MRPLIRAAALRSLLPRIERLLRFGAVGLVCSGLQLVGLAALVELGLGHDRANLIALLTGTQVNFVLSALVIWPDRPAQHQPATWAGRLLAFNASATGTLAINQGVFMLAVRLIPYLMAGALGIAVAAPINFVIQHFLIFRPGQKAPQTPEGSTPMHGKAEGAAWHTARHAASIAAVFPAYNEEANLAVVVAAARRALAEAADDYRIVVVNDGSSDRTSEVADRLAAEDPQHLVIVTHPVNRGYGAAVRSGIEAALATGSEWIFLTDSEGQFDPREIRCLLDPAIDQQGDLVAGRRIRRADPAVRRLNALLWSAACRLLFRIPVHDVDCAFKLVHRRVLETITLTGEAAVISPELLARARGAGFRLAEVPVSHYPRHSGEQTGANPKVIARSLLGLAELRLEITRERLSSRYARRPLHSPGRQAS